MALISVVIASFNHAAFIQECLHSVLTQDDGQLEILITDDGSTDDTVDRILAMNDPRVRLNVFAQNRGACAALNDAIVRSKGDYIAVLNSDDQFLPGKLQRQLEFMERNAEIGAVFGLPTFVNESGQPFLDTSHKDFQVFNQQNRTRHQWLRHFFDHGNALCHPTAMMRRKVFIDVGLYDPRLAQVPDLDQWIRLCMRYDIHVMPEALTAFRIRDGLQNASAARPDVIRRDAWERAYVLRHYLKLDPDELLAVFPEFTDKETGPTEQMARYALQKAAPFFQRFALDAWFNGLPDGGQLDTGKAQKSQLGEKASSAWRRYIAAVGAVDPHRIHRL